MLCSSWGRSVHCIWKHRIYPLTNSSFNDCCIFPVTYTYIGFKCIIYFSKIFVNSSIGGQLSAPPNTTITFETVRNANKRCGMLDICRNTESNSEDHTYRREETWKAREGTPTILYSDELCPTILFGLTFNRDVFGI